MKITMAHGSGGKSSAELMKAVFGKYFKNDIDIDYVTSYNNKVVLFSYILTIKLTNNIYFERKDINERNTYCKSKRN